MIGLLCACVTLGELRNPAKKRPASHSDSIKPLIPVSALPVIRIQNRKLSALALAKTWVEDPLRSFVA
ncbi:MAG: hypothetical protein CO065_09130 [Comamonadaceae bacterium CG_4_9_14_0_8_um_filter_57_21]|nr:MAG: hypothetical protein CO065_09130 [Comamonadaceae bacterium CG_4_9_14_0_8_um_filter_57_21]